MDHDICGATPALPSGKIYLRKYRENVSIDRINWQKLPPTKDGKKDILKNFTIFKGSHLC